MTHMAVHAAVLLLAILYGFAYRDGNLLGLLLAAGMGALLQLMIDLTHGISLE